mgnify:CR=1 FL=1
MVDSFLDTFSDNEFRIEDVTWIADGSASFARGEVSFNILGPICAIDSVDLYHDEKLVESWDVVDSQMSFATDESLCDAEAAFFALNVGGQISETAVHHLKRIQGGKLRYAHSSIC